ncbi:MAG: S1 RNA-binding domain-containing protein [Candidatus Pacebacteria bacterium]|jgi:small subunit ribosomal protein S1|nr:S1 RNA-binding domain-containing protein [Candidatus Paceibacterota bacterium]
MTTNETTTEETTIIRMDDIVEGTVAAIEKAALYVDLGLSGTGIIYGAEFMNARDVIKRINIGDMISAKVIVRENKEGYIELSLKEARQALMWSDAEVAIKEKRIMDLVVKDANKGGLIMEWQGITGFLPASQLKEENYPRVEDGDKDKILRELKKLIGKRISVSIINAIPKEGKLIFSEKDGGTKEAKEIVSGNYTLGDEVNGTVTGVVEFGIFVKLDDGVEGLVHKSEIDWGLVEDTKTHARVGDKVRAKIIEVKDGKISLSLKALKENPWKEAAQKYKKGDEVEGVVIKFNKHGALVSVEEGVAGLVHVSDFGDEGKLREALSLGKSYKFTITLFDANEERMTLSYVK